MKITNKEISYVHYTFDSDIKRIYDLYINFMNDINNWNLDKQTLKILKCLLLDRQHNLIFIEDEKQKQICEIFQISEYTFNNSIRSLKKLKIIEGRNGLFIILHDNLCWEHLDDLYSKFKITFEYDQTSKIE